MKTRTKIGLAMFVVLLVALTTTAVLGYFIYERTLSGLVTSRFEFIAKELKSRVEAGIDLGLPLGQLENIDELLRQEMTKDDSLVAISIISTGGRVLFDTRAERIGQSAPSALIQTPSKLDLTPERVYFGESTIEAPLFTSFGKMVGVLLVSYSGTFYDDKRLGVAGDLVTVIFVVLIVAAAIGITSVLTISRPLDTAVARLGAGLNGLRHKVGLALPGEPAPIPDLRHDSEIEQKLLQAIISLEQAEQLLSIRTAGPPPTKASS